MKSVSKRLAYTMLTQSLILLLSLITGFIMPNAMGDSQFGYWSLYLFYMAYLNLIGCGYSDGYTLINAGAKDQDLQSPRHRSALRLLMALFTILAVLSVLVLYGGNFHDPDKSAVFFVLAVNIPNVCIQSILLSILLAGNRSAAYNNINLLLKALSTLLILLLLVGGQKAFLPVILADSAARLLLTFVCIYLCRGHIWGTRATLAEAWQDIRETCGAGIKVTLSFILASVMPLTGRIVLEHRHDMALYGQYSFAMTLLTIIITFTSTAGVVIFPMMRTFQTEVLTAKYKDLRHVVDHLISLAFIVYILVFLIISRLMQDYMSVLSYIGFILAMSLPIARIQLIITPFYKTLRFERAFLIWNLLGFVLSFAACSLAYELVQTPVSLASASLLIMLLWSYAVEAYLYKKCNLTIDWKHEVRSIFLLSAFVLGCVFQSLSHFVLLYLPFLLLYTLAEKQDLQTIWRNYRGGRHA